MRPTLGVPEVGSKVAAFQDVRVDIAVVNILTDLGIETRHLHQRLSNGQI